MTTFYSPAYTTETPTLVSYGVSADDPVIRVAPGTQHSTVRRSHQVIDLASATVADEDYIRFFTMRSSDRLFELYYSGAAAWAGTTLTLHVGLALSGANHDGAVLDDDLFSSALDGLLTTDHEDQFSMGALSGEDRGKQLWELVEIGATQGWTEDPGLDFDMVIHVDEFVSVTVNSEMSLDARYTSGGN